MKTFLLLCLVGIGLAGCDFPARDSTGKPLEPICVAGMKYTVMRDSLDGKLSLAVWKSPDGKPIACKD